jgi:hypothetical protein
MGCVVSSYVAIENPDAVVHWFKSDPWEKGRRPVGPCPHSGCPHNAQSVVAWGPDFEHYELVVCDTDDPGGCDGMCRGWLATDDNHHGGTHGQKYRQAPRFMMVDRPIPERR